MTTATKTTRRTTIHLKIVDGDDDSKELIIYECESEPKKEDISTFLLPKCRPPHPPPPCHPFPPHPPHPLRPPRPPRQGKPRKSGKFGKKANQVNKTMNLSQERIMSSPARAKRLMQESPKTPRHPSNGYEVCSAVKATSSESPQPSQPSHPSQSPHSPSCSSFFAPSPSQTSQTLLTPQASQTPRTLQPSSSARRRSLRIQKRELLQQQLQQDWMNCPLQSPTKSEKPDEKPEKSEAKSPAKSSATSPTKPPARRASLGRSPKKLPPKSPSKLPTKSPVMLPPNSPSKLPPKSPSKPRAKSSLKAIAKSDHKMKSSDNELFAVEKMNSSLSLPLPESKPPPKTSSMQSPSPARRRSLRILERESPTPIKSRASLPAFSSHRFGDEFDSEATPISLSTSTDEDMSEKSNSNNKSARSKKRKKRRYSARFVIETEELMQKKTCSLGVGSTENSTEVSTGGPDSSSTKLFGISTCGQKALVNALEKIVRDAMESSLMADGSICSITEDITDGIKDGSSGSDVASKFCEDASLSDSKTEEVTASTTSPFFNGEDSLMNDDSSLDDDKENVDKETVSIMDRHASVSQRRDTFDLRRRINALKEPLSKCDSNSNDCEAAPSSIDSSVSSTGGDMGSVSVITKISAASKPNASDKDALRKKLFDATAANREVCTITEGNSSAQNNPGEEMPHDVIADEISRSLDDGPRDKVKDVDDQQQTPTSSKKNLQDLSSIEIEREMGCLFSQFKVYNYPCVSPRIFSAMIAYEGRENFKLLLPLFSSLVNAEIVSLKNKEEFRDVYFINKKVCFSGFDYSSTTPAVDRISGSHVDLCSSIEALEKVLQQAQLLPHSTSHLDFAIQCLEEMTSCDDVSVACAKTVVGYFPSSRFEKAIKHYLQELQDIKCYILSENPPHVGHIGVRYRLGDFIGRSIRFHLRQMLNSIPDETLDFDVSGCDERWGRAVDDRSISSIFNFALEKIDEFCATNSKLLEDEADFKPSFFSKEASAHALSLPKRNLNNLTSKELEDFLSDIKEARAFLFGARACKFAHGLLRWPGVVEHIDDSGGWSSVESFATIFYDLQLQECSDNKHFILLKNIHELSAMLKKAVGRLEETVETCEEFIKRLRKKVQARKKEASYFIKGSPVYAIRMCLMGEMEENFPVLTESHEDCESMGEI